MFGPCHKALNCYIDKSSDFTCASNRLEVEEEEQQKVSERQVDLIRQAKTKEAQLREALLWRMAISFSFSRILFLSCPYLSLACLIKSPAAALPLPQGAVPPPSHGKVCTPAILALHPTWSCLLLHHLCLHATNMAM